MGTNSNTTNGASLEDCHTNIFVLTELNGLKWKKFVTSDQARGCTEISKDPILYAYGRCLSEGLLCVWRRAPPTSTDRPTPAGPAKLDVRLDTEKELWVFWYADEPDILKNLTSSLTNPEDGRGSWQQSLEYETRTLLFKALHNLIERCLFSKGFVRLGKWFAQPLDSDGQMNDQAQPTHILAFNFSFFVHGESNVCVCVSTQRQPSIYKLSRRHLLQKTKQSVVLAPWCLSGTLNPGANSVALGSGETFGYASSYATERQANCVWSEWSKFYPLKAMDDNTENLGYVNPVEEERQEAAKLMALPKMIEVSVAGVRMLYPSCYVAVLASEDQTLLARAADCKRDKKASGNSCQTTPQKRQTDMVDEDTYQQRHCERYVSGALVCQRAVESTMITSRNQSTNDPSSGQTTPNGSATPNMDGVPSVNTNDEVQWYFTDSCQKEMCGCKLTAGAGASFGKATAGTVLSKAALKFGATIGHQRQDKQSRINRSLGVFHRRSPLTVNSEQDEQSTLINSQQSIQLDSDTKANVLLPCSTDPSQSRFICINTTSLPPHEPITQMISPVATTVPPQSMTQTEIKKEDYLYQTATVTTRPIIEKNVIVAGHKLPNRDTVSLRTKQQLKRPKLDLLNAVVVGEQNGEYLQSDQLYEKTSNDCGWRMDHRSDLRAAKRSLPSSSALSSLQSDQQWKQSKTCDDGVQVNAEVTTVAPIGYIKLEDDGTEDDYTAKFKMELNPGQTASLVQPTVNNQWEPSQTWSNRDLQPSATLPDNILDDGSNGQQTSPSTSFMSPPASNETDHNQQGIRPTTSLAPTTTAGCSQPQTNFVPPKQNGPPSVEYIYPTPPSMEPHHQMSPENRQMTNNVNVMTLAVTSEYGDMSPVVRTNSATTSAIEKMAFPTTSSVPAALPVVCPKMDKTVIFDKPQLANYLASSKFFGSCHLKRERCDYGTLPQYNPSRTLPSTSKVNNNQITQLKQPSTPGQPRANSSFGRSYSMGPMTPSPYTQEQETPSPGFSGTGLPGYQGQSGPSSVMQRTPSGMQRTPSVGPVGDIQSPLSNVSSSYPANLNSIDNPALMGSCSIGAGIKTPEAHSLVLTLLMSDTFIDLHHDSNFDSCSFCACAGSNIRGLEMGLYVPLPPPITQNQMFFNSRRCSCGFSASRYRYLASNSGLLQEDEFEATGLRNRFRIRDRLDNFLSDNLETSFLELVRQQALTHNLASGSCSNKSLSRQCDEMLVHRGARNLRLWNLNEYIDPKLEINDFRNLCHSAMEAACMVMDCTIPSKADFEARSKTELLNCWGFQKASREVERDNEALCLLMELLPLFTEALRTSKGLWNASHSVEGPLTWRHFERKILRPTPSNEEECQPEPVPQILMTTERDFVTISPLSLRLWDRLLLEPFNQPKDVVYVAVIPDNPLVTLQSRIFFRELSKTYENHRLGRHCPFAKVLRDGLLRVGPTKLKPLQDKGYKLDSQFFDNLSNVRNDESTLNCSEQMKKEFIDRIKGYAQVLKNDLAPLLEHDGAFDRGIFRDIGKENQPPANNEQMPPPPVPGDLTHNPDTNSNQDLSNVDQIQDSELGTLPHVVVIYLVNPFAFGAENHNSSMARYTTVALLQAFLCMLTQIKESLRPFVQLEIVEQQTIMDCTATMSDCMREERSSCVMLHKDNMKSTGNPFMPRAGAAESLKTLALSVYTQNRALTAQCLLNSQAKTLTGFGPASARVSTIQMQMQQPRFYRVYCSPYVLVPPVWQKPAITNGSDMLQGTLPKDEDVLFVSYCFSDDQHWLLATATDQQGSLLENCVINLNLYQNHDRMFAKHSIFVREAIFKLWNFVQGILALGCKPWRIVIGRLGRVGHKELKVWYTLLHKPNLKHFSYLLRDCCGQCSKMPSYNETPSILSACFVSLEPEPFLRVFPGSFTHDDRFGQGAKLCPLSTPTDATCTHILVFPTSALLHPAPALTPGTGAEDVELPVDFDELMLEDDLLTDLAFEVTPGAPIGMARTSQFIYPESDPSIDNQPLAVGYYISTAPAPCLPSWFWSSCPWARRRLPVHLKASLHINVTGVQQNDDLLSLGSKKSSNQQQHSLESTQTSEVLRYVLETYNALSWLNVDVENGDRKSCLPIHIQALLRLHHTVPILDIAI